MGTITNTDISTLSRRLTAELLECEDVENTTRCRIFSEAGGQLVCKATPARMELLLDQLEDKTTELANSYSVYDIDVPHEAVAAARAALGPMASLTAVNEYAETTTKAQWDKDYSNWLLRLDKYRGHLEDVKEQHPESWDKPEGCNLITKTLIDPLLFGWFWEPMPGIMQTTGGKKNVQTRPDWVSPFTLGNQINVYRDSMREAANELIQDLTDPAGAGCRNSLDPRCWDWPTVLFWGAIIGGGVLTLVAISRAVDLAERIQVLRGASGKDQGAREAQEVRIRVETDDRRSLPRWR